MFGPLAQERRNRLINTVQNKIIRESVLDLVEDEETGETCLDSQELFMDPEQDIPEDVLDSVESEVNKVVANKDIENMTDDELDAVADQIISGLDSLDALK